MIAAQPARFSRYSEFSYSGRHDDDWASTSFRGECESSGKDFQIPMATILSEAIVEFPLIAIDAQILGGTPRLAGTRIPVSMVLDAVQHYGTIEGAIRSYPDLIPDQVREAISFASVVVERPIEFDFKGSSR